MDKNINSLTQIYDSDETTVFHPLTVCIKKNAHNGDVGCFDIPLPTTADNLQLLFHSEELSDFDGARIGEVTSEIEGLGRAVTEAFPKSLSNDAFSALNYLAALISEMTDDERATFDAVVQAGWQIDSMLEIINVAKSPESIYIYPEKNEKEYGAFLVEAFGADTVNSLEKLGQSEEIEDRDLARYIQWLEAAVDHEKLGRLYATKEKGAIMETGYITQLGKCYEDYCDFEDIPEKYRVFVSLNSDFSEKEVQYE
jgi:hypothetical protein